MPQASPQGPGRLTPALCLALCLSWLAAPALAAPPAAPAAPAAKAPAQGEAAWAKEMPAIERRRQARLDYVQAVTEFNAGRYQNAVRLLQQCLAVLPGDEQARKLLALAQEQARKSQTGSLQVTSTPPAEVFLDGRPLGRTPLNLPALAVGRYKLQARRGGFSREHDLVIKPRTATSVTFDLQSQLQVQVLHAPGSQQPRPGRGFVLQVPLGWRLAPKTAAADLRLSPSQGQGLIQVNSGPLRRAGDLKQQVRMWEDEFFASGTPLQDKQNGRSLSLGGVKAYEAVYQGGGQKAKFYFLVASGRLYVLRGVFPQAEYALGAKALDEVAESFRPQ
ncbi:MAG: PEGA domain-containing protein [Thermodesulfobacteriota bacterium]